MGLTRSFKQFASAKYGVKSTSDGRSSAQGCGVTWQCAAVAAYAVANGAVYANAAVATFVLAAAAAVFVVGPVAYLDDKTGAESRLTSIEKDKLTMQLATALKL